MVLPIVDEYLSRLRIDGDAVHVVEVAGPLLAGRRPFLSPCHQELAVLVELHDARVGVAVGDIERAVGQPRDERRPVEMLVIGGVYVRLADRLQQPLAVVAENENGVTVVVDDPHALLRIVGADVDGMRPAQHLVPLRPVLDNVAVRVDDDDAVLPAEVLAGLADVRIVAHSPVALERARRARRRGVAPRQPSDREFDVRPELRQLDLFRSLEIRELAPLQDEDAVRALGEHALPGSPRPLLVAGQGRQRFRPVGHGLVRPEDVLPAFLAGHRRQPDILSRLAARSCRSVAGDDKTHRQTEGG